MTPTDDAARYAADVVADGIQWLQVKVPGEPDVDLAIIKAIRKEVGDDINIFPDINRGYRNIKPAINVINAMYGEANICAVEQPTEGSDAMAAITRAVDVPVIVDEGCWSPQDASEVVRRNSADVISIYFTKAGGLYRSMEIGAIAHGAGLPVNVNGSLEGGVGNAANLHLSAALDGVVLPGVITINTLEGREQTKVGGVFYKDDVITEPFEYADGHLKVPDGPGLGIEIDPKKLRNKVLASLLILCGWHPVDAWRCFDENVINMDNFHDSDGFHRPTFYFNDLSHSKRPKLKVTNTVGCGCKGAHHTKNIACPYNLLNWYQQLKDEWALALDEEMEFEVLQGKTHREARKETLALKNDPSSLAPETVEKIQNKVPLRSVVRKVLGVETEMGNIK